MNSNRLKMAVLLMLVAFMSVAYASIFETSTNFEIAPNPMENRTTVFLNASQKVTATVTIETDSGTVLKTLFTGSLEAGSYQFDWDRYSDTGVYVPKGKYFVSLTYTSKYTMTKKTLILK